MKKRNGGITLIALIVTIVVLLILAGVSLNFIAGEQGILRRAEKGVSRTDEETAREKLNLELQTLLIDKKTNPEYSEIYLKNELEDQGFTFIEENIVMVDGYQFMIDKENLKVIESIGKGKENSEIKITTTQQITDNKGKCILSITIEYAGTIQSVTMAGEKIEKQEDKYVAEITQNGSYTILVRDDNNGYRIEKVEISGLRGYVSEIWKVEDLIQFKDGVESGLSYEGKTVKLKANLNLENVTWEPIGYYISEEDKVTFKGTFDGENHTISNLSMEVASKAASHYGGGFFGCIEEGTVKNLNLENVSISSEVVCTGAVVGCMYGGLIENVKVLSGEVSSVKGDIGGIAGEVIGTVRNCLNQASVYTSDMYAGGIVAAFAGNLSGCVNKGDVSSIKKGAGGICCQAYVGNGLNIETIVENCYNTGTITVNNGGFLSGGICAMTQCYDSNEEGKNPTIKSCYNMGEVSSNTGKSNQTGDIGGIIGNIIKESRVTFCYNLGTIKQTGWAGQVGGIVGVINDPSEVSQCYNKGNVESQYYRVGGLCGKLASANSRMHDCYISNEAIVRYKNSVVTKPIGSASYAANVTFGRLLGQSVSVNCYSDLEDIEDAQMPSVYDVMNEFKKEKSTVWSDSNPNAPQLLWETNGK